MGIEVGYEAENAFLEKVQSGGLQIHTIEEGKFMVVTRAEKSSGNASYDFLCEITAPNGKHIRSVYVELKASRKGTVVLTDAEMNFANSKRYGTEYVLVVARHNKSPGFEFICATEEQFKSALQTAWQISIPKPTHLRPQHLRK